MSPRLGIGLIGLGEHGSRYARHIVEDLTDAALGAVCRRKRPEGEQLATASRCAFYEDYHDLVANPHVDAAVMMVLPTRSTSAPISTPSRQAVYGLREAAAASGLMA